MAAGLRPREVRAMLAATLEMGEGDLVAEIGALPGLLEASSLEEIIRAAAAGARGDEGRAGGVGEAEEGESGQEEVDVDQGEVEEEETEDEAAELAGLNR